MHQSTAGIPSKPLESLSLHYGSAKLTGFEWKDYTCIKPIQLDGQNDKKLTNSTYLASISPENE